MDTGFLIDEPIEKYHSGSAISRSTLMYMNKSEKAFEWAYVKGNKKTQTPEMIFGNAFHTYILENHCFYDRYAIKPEGVKRNTKAGKALWSEFEKTLDGRDVISAQDMTTIVRMTESLVSSGAIDFIHGAHVEKSIYFSMNGVSFKARPDIIRISKTSDGGTLVVVGDIKTSKNASPRAFERDSYNMGYYLQAAMINEALEFHGVDTSEIKFLYLVVEKEPPYDCGIYMLDGSAVFYGAAKLQELSLRVQKCLKENKYESYGFQCVGLPGYASKEEL